MEPSSYKPQTTRIERPIGIVLGVAFAVFLFWGIGYSQYGAYQARPKTESIEVAVPLSPPEVKELSELKKTSVNPTEVIPELKEEPPTLTLDQLDLVLNPGLGGLAVSDLGLPQFDTAQTKMNMDQIFDPSDLDTKPRATKRVMPLYPRRLEERGITGKVVVFFIVETDGSISNIKIESATRKEFERAVLKVIGDWRFSPGLREGRKVRYKVRLPVPFGKL